MKALLTLAMLLGSASLPAHAVERAEITKELIRIVSEICQVPEKQHSYASYNFERFVGQATDPSDPMLNTAFLVGYTTMSSSNRASGYCTCLFMGIPANPTWEAGNFTYRLYETALQLKSVPAQVLDSVNLETGEIKLRAFVPATP